MVLKIYYWFKFMQSQQIYINSFKLLLLLDYYKILILYEIVILSSQFNEKYSLHSLLYSAKNEYKS